MIIKTESDVTTAVVSAMESIEDSRLREILQRLAHHLHAFIREVKLTESEFRQATEVINAIGQASNNRHNEAVLLAGSLGVSQLVCLLNNINETTETTSQNLLGPFWRQNSPVTENGGSIVRCKTSGSPMHVELKFHDEAGKPVSDLEVDIWQCNSEGLYENQDPNQVEMNLRGKFQTGLDGRIWFESVKQSGYPVPTGSVAGRLLGVQKRHPFRPAHLHVLAHKQGYKTLITQIYDQNDQNLDTDAQFGVTEELIGNFQKQTDSGEYDKKAYCLNHLLVMQAGISRLPQPPIE